MSGSYCEKNYINHMYINLSTFRAVDLTIHYFIGGRFDQVSLFCGADLTRTDLVKGRFVYDLLIRQIVSLYELLSVSQYYFQFQYKFVK